MKYKPNRDIPRFIEKYHTFQPKELREIILKERNHDASIETLCNWMRRHKDIIDKIRETIIEQEKPQEEVSPTIFENGTFEELPSVKNWKQEMQDRVLAPNHIKTRIGILKQICKGSFPRLKFNPIIQESDETKPIIDDSNPRQKNKLILAEPNEPIDKSIKELNWCYKHPDRLTLDESRDLVRVMRDKGYETAQVRFTLRNFLLSKGITVGDKISGAKEKGYGKFANLYVPLDQLIKLLAKIKELDLEVALVSLFMFKTGTRISATLDSTIEDLDFDNHTVKGIDKGRHSKGRKPFKKYLDAELEHELKTFIGQRQTGKLFTIAADQSSQINREAMKIVIPDLEPKIEMPNHFWRHMFAQHMLRLTNWNYSAVAYLGSWTVKALQESYGAPPDEIIKQWGLNYLPLIQVNTEAAQ